METETCTCPNCKTLLDEENLIHDGYRGSSSAHNGAGSYGVGRHHYYHVCECGWSSRPDLDAEKAQRARPQRTAGAGGQKYDGYKYGAKANPADPHTVFTCPSRLTKKEKKVIDSAKKASVLGHCYGHSLLSSCRYALVPDWFLEELKEPRETRTMSGVGANYVAAT